MSAKAQQPAKLAWVERDIDDIMRSFADGFKSADGRIIKYEYTIDTTTRRVIFKLYIVPHEKESPRSS